MRDDRGIVTVAPSQIREAALTRFVFDDLTVDQMMGMADGLLRAGQYDLAQKLYGALQKVTEGRKADVVVRRGLASNPRRQTPIYLDLLDALKSYNGSAFVSEGLATWNKILPFFHDPRFSTLVTRHAHLLPIPNWHWNLQTIAWAARQAGHVPGDFMELGVFRGHTTLFAADYLGFADWPKTWWLYDTFEGIPEDQLDKGWEGPNKVTYGGTYSFEEVRDRFEPFPNIRVVQGRVPEILTEQAPEQIAFLHMDLNNATAEIAALDALFDRISPGGVIVFDDYCWQASRIQHEAEKAWFAARGLQILPLPTGQGVFVKGAGG